MSVISEFREFINRGNVLDLAIGVVVGAAFGKVIEGVVTDIMMPPISLASGGVRFSQLKWVLKAGVGKEGDADYSPEIALTYGHFIEQVILFLIVAFCIFLVVKAVNAMKRKEIAVDEPAGPSITKEQEILTEIRDLLAQGK